MRSTGLHGTFFVASDIHRASQPHARRVVVLGRRGDGAITRTGWSSPTSSASRPKGGQARPLGPDQGGEGRLHSTHAQEIFEKPTTRARPFSARVRFQGARQGVFSTVRYTILTRQDEPVAAVFEEEGTNQGPCATRHLQGGTLRGDGRPKARSSLAYRTYVNLRRENRAARAGILPVEVRREASE